jgi:hypothetical protein
MSDSEPRMETSETIDPYCPDCGSEFACNCEDDGVCYECGGDGYVVADCFEDTCCCADPEEEHGLIICPNCRGGK